MGHSSLISRLYQDLAELHDSPYPGVDVFIDDADVRRLCLILTPPSGPWKNLALHFDVFLPDEWPALPPRVSCSVNGINHPNLFGSYVCCDLLKTEDEIWREKGYIGGYTPALTLRGLFLQFLTFFSSPSIDQDYGGSTTVGESVIVRYVLEADLKPTRASRRVSRNGTPDSSASPSSWHAFHERWESDDRPEIAVNVEMSEIGPLRDTVKDPRVSSHRLHRIEVKNSRWAPTLRTIQRWTCDRCQYGRGIPHCAVAGAAEEIKKTGMNGPMPPTSCLLDTLNDDVLYELAQRMPSESIINFGTAYPRFHGLTESMHILLQRELRCFFLRSPLHSSVLGIGVAFDPRSRTLASDFDWLSHRAFTVHGVRKSVEKRDFGFFLPLAFSPAHFERAYPLIWTSLAEIDKQLRAAEQQMSRNPRWRPTGPARHDEIVEVVYRMMNNIVVSLMKSCDQELQDHRGHAQTLMHASEKAITAYCHLFHLLMCLCRKDPSILSSASRRLRQFIENKAKRVKLHVPDLGELIVLIMVVLCQPHSGAQIRWSNLVGPFLGEAVVRNVRWVLRDSPHLEVLEQGPSDYRLNETFSRSKTSLRLIMFQIAFLDLFSATYASNISRLDDNYGFPDPDIPMKMVQQVKAIYVVGTWPEFFKRVHFQRGLGFTKAVFCDMLRDAVRTSGSCKYHCPPSPHRRAQLTAERRAMGKLS